MRLIKYTYSTFLVFILTPFCLYLQGQEKKIYGSIVDENLNSKIPYANISIVGSYIGTCSNRNGEFVFNYPDSLSKGQLIVSCIGYKNYFIELKTINKEDTLNIYLIPTSYSIRSVDVFPDQLSAYEIVKQVIRNLHKNYSRKPYYLTGFLRDRVYNIYNNKNTRLTEAAVEIEKQELANNKYQDKVKIVEIRNSYNYSKLGNNVLYNLKKIIYGFSDENPIYTTLQFGDYSNPSVLRKLLKNDLFVPFVSGIVMLDNKPVTIIELKQKYYEAYFKKWPTDNKLYRLIRLYVDTGSYAIIKSEYYMVTNFSNNKNRIELQIKDDTIKTFAVKQYVQKDGLYYLRYAGYYGKVFDQPDSQKDRNTYYNDSELLINRLIVDKKEFDRIKRKDLLKKDVSLWNIEYTYNSDFWNNYNILIDKPLDPKVKSDLEQDIPLEKQFFNTGN